MYRRSVFEYSLENSSRAQNPQSLYFSAPLFSQTCACSIPQTLSFDRLSQNTLGEGWVYFLADTDFLLSCPVFSLTPSPARSLLKTYNLKLPTDFLTPLDAPLADTPFRKSFVYHSYKKCRGSYVRPSVLGRGTRRLRRRRFGSETSN